MSKLANEIVEIAVSLQEKIERYNNKHSGSNVLIVIGQIGNSKHFSVNCGESASEKYARFKRDTAGATESLIQDSGRADS